MSRRARRYAAARAAKWGDYTPSPNKPDDQGCDAALALVAAELAQRRQLESNTTTDPRKEKR
jgi:hypothetical protein